MTRHRDAAASKPALSENPQYNDIERVTGDTIRCADCLASAEFSLKDNSGHRLPQCAECLVETFRKDPEMTGRVMRSVAERL